MGATWLTGALTLEGFRWDFLANPLVMYVYTFLINAIRAFHATLLLHVGWHFSSLADKGSAEKTHHFTLLDGEMIIDTVPDSQKQERRYLIYDLIVINHVPVIEVGFSLLILFSYRKTSLRKLMFTRIFYIAFTF